MSHRSLVRFVLLLQRCSSTSSSVSGGQQQFSRDYSINVFLFSISNCHWWNINRTQFALFIVFTIFRYCQYCSRERARKVLAHSFEQCIIQKRVRGENGKRQKKREQERETEREKRKGMYACNTVNTQCIPEPARLSLPEYRSFGSQPTYYLFIRTVPGWSATWQNRLREFAEPAFLG